MQGQLLLEGHMGLAGSPTLAGSEGRSSLCFTPGGAYWLAKTTMMMLPRNWKIKGEA